MQNVHCISNFEESIILVLRMLDEKNICLFSSIAQIGK